MNWHKQTEPKLVQGGVVVCICSHIVAAVGVVGCGSLFGFGIGATDSESSSGGELIDGVCKSLLSY